MQATHGRTEPERRPGGRSQQLLLADEPAHGPHAPAVIRRPDRGNELKSQFLAVAEAILAARRVPMTTPEIVDAALEERLLSDKLRGRTPSQTMTARLSTHIRRLGKRSTFVRTGPGRFFLRELLDDPNKVYESPPFRPAALRERVLVVDSEKAAKLLRFQGLRTDGAASLLTALCGHARPHYLDRLTAERTERFKQLVTYVLVIDGKRVLGFTRGNFTRVADFLRGARCIGFGGHVVEEDRSLLSLADFGVREAALRELREELRLPRSDLDRLSRGAAAPRLYGIINDDSSSVGRRHIGVAFTYNIATRSEWEKPRPGERAVSGLTWHSPDVVARQLATFEYWSQLCLRSLYREKVRASSSYLVRRKSRLKPPNVLCVIGPIGSGKSEATRVLVDRFGYREVNSGRVLAHLLNARAVTERTRKRFQEAAARFISRRNGPRLLANAIWRECERLGSDRLLVDGIRHRATLSALRDRAKAAGRGLGIVFVHAAPDTAFDLYCRRRGERIPFEEFLALRDARVEQDVHNLIQDSDAVLYNWVGLNSYQSTIVEMFSDIGITIPSRHR